MQGGALPCGNASGGLQGPELRALLAVPVLAPPGAEDIALRALGALLSASCALHTLRQAAVGALQVRALLCPSSRARGPVPCPATKHACRTPCEVVYGQGLSTCVTCCKVINPRRQACWLIWVQEQQQPVPGMTQAASFLGAWWQLVTPFFAEAQSVLNRQTPLERR